MEVRRSLKPRDCGEILRTCLLILICLMSLLGVGCARAVTDKTVNLTLDLKLNFRGTIDTTHYRYYILLSTSTNPLLPAVGTQEYFPTPGNRFDSSNSYFLNHSSGINYYYQNFYSSWSDYFVTVGNTFNLYQSGSTQFNPATTQNAVYVPVSRLSMGQTLSGTQIHVAIPLQYLSSSGSVLYFAFCTTSITDSPVVDGTESGMILDQLRNRQYISLPMQAGSPSGTIQEPPNSDVSAAADLISWEAYIF